MDTRTESQKLQGGPREGAAPTDRKPTTADEWTIKLGALMGVIGALLGMAGNLMHPVTPAGDPEGVARVIAGSEAWIAVHLVIVVGLILMLGGLVAIGRSLQIEDGVPAALARLGEVTAVAGITVGLILVTLDGLAAKHLADAWAHAPAAERTIALRLVTSEETFNFALAALFNILFAGATFILFGVATAKSRAFPGWLGWLVVIPGIGSAIVGLVQAYAGESTDLTRSLTIVFPTVITLWLATMGIVLMAQVKNRRRPL